MQTSQVNKPMQFTATQMVVAILIFMFGFGAEFCRIGLVSDRGGNANLFVFHSNGQESPFPEESNESNSAEELPALLRRFGARFHLRQRRSQQTICAVLMRCTALSEIESGPIFYLTPNVDVPGARSRLNGFGGNLLL